MALSETKNMYFFWVFFDDFCISWKIAVALCGAMWRYPKQTKMQFFSITFCNFCVSCKIAVALCGAMWRYVALFDTSKNACFVTFLRFLCFLKNSCGTMWRYVALSERNKMHYFVTFCDLCVFLNNSCGTMRRYVALCGTIRNEQKMIFWQLFAIYVFLGK